MRRPYCGVATATIEVRGEDVMWRNIAHSTFDYEEDRWNHEPVDSLREMRFKAGEYETAIRQRPTGRS